MLRTTSLPCVRSFSTSRQRPKRNLNEAPKEHSCNIPPWKPPVPPPQTTLGTKFPDFLVRPPCLPGSTIGERQTCIIGQEGLYCPPCRIEYKYPPFSENIERLANTIQPPCWWKMPGTCENDVDDSIIHSITRRLECSYD